jgi:hypothetical protein
MKKMGKFEFKITFKGNLARGEGGGHKIIEAARVAHYFLKN